MTLENIIENRILEFSKNLIKLPNLKYLDISSNQIGDDGLSSLANNLKYISKLKTLNCYVYFIHLDNCFNNQGVIQLSRNLVYVTNLLGLDLRSIKYILRK